MSKLQIFGITLLWFCLPIQLSGVTINGQVQSFVQQEVLLNVLFGRFYMQMDNISIPIDPEGRFRYEIQVDEIRFAQMKFGEQTIQLLLDPKFAFEVQSLNEIKEQIHPKNYQILRAELHHYYLTLRILAGTEVGWRSPDEYESHWMIRNDRLGKVIDCAVQNKYSPYYNHLMATYYDHLRLKISYQFP